MARSDFHKKIIKTLTSPSVDKVIALIAIVPLIHLIWRYFNSGKLTIWSLGLVLQIVMLAATMVVRRPPVRITANPLFWLLAGLATYWPIIMLYFYERHNALAIVPEGVSTTLALLGLGLSAWARLSLGRNIGFVPAEREIVTNGAYAYVRHPIYSALFVSIAAVDFQGFSLRNAALDLAWCGLWVVKSLIEEKFLSESPSYKKYMEQVRWRWAPGIC